MFKASIDIGSNSVLLLVASFDSQGRLVEHASEATVCALGRDLDKNKVFHDESMKDTLDTLKAYRKIIDKFEINPDDVVITATEASRVAQNAQEFYLEVKELTGFVVSIISSEGEAHYTAKGVSLGLSNSAEAILMDVGGASTELIRMRPHPFQLMESISLPIGSVRAGAWREEGLYEQKWQKIRSDFSDIDSYKTKRLVGVAGTMTAICGMMKGLSAYDAKKINAEVIEFSLFKDFIKKWEGSSPEEILSSYPILGKRAKTIVSGGLVAVTIGEALGVEEIEISTFGLRHGTLASGKIDTCYLMEV